MNEFSYRDLLDPQKADEYWKAIEQKDQERLRRFEDEQAVAAARAREIIPHHDDIIAIARYVNSMRIDWLTEYSTPKQKGWTKFRIALFQSFVLSMLAGNGVMLEADQSSAGSIFNPLSKLAGFGDSLESVGEDESGQ